MSNEKYIAFLDILGFKELILRNDTELIVSFYEQIADLLTDWKDSSFFKDNVALHLFQDTIVVLSRGNTRSDFMALIEYLTVIMGFAFLHRVFLRGAVTKGEVIVTDNIVIGKGIVKAFEMEKVQEWIGCWVDSKCVKEHPEVLKFGKDGFPLVIKYDVPRKAGKVKKLFAINWTFVIVQSKPMKKSFAIAWKRMWESGDKWPEQRKMEDTDRFLRFLELKNHFPRKELLKSLTK